MRYFALFGLLAVIGCGAGCGAASPLGSSCSMLTCPGGAKMYKYCVANDGSGATYSDPNGNNSTNCATVNPTLAKCESDATAKACQ
jgi:hypothetical protein